MGDFNQNELNELMKNGWSYPTGGKGGGGFTILGYYDTVDALRAAVTNPEAGDAYGVGTAAPYSTYVWDSVSSDWIDNGTIAQGPEGPQGLKGDKGEQGPKGDTGYSPTITENTDNTEDIYKLDVVNETDSFTTPNLKGKQGVQGLQGIRGEKGDKGDIGLTGESGISPTITENEDNSDTVYKLDITDANGSFTTQNLVGKQGPQGIQGEQGARGEQGIQGPVGVSPTLVENENNTDEVYKLDITDANGTFTTPNLVGRQGVQGIQGEVGPQGEQGIQGIQGIQGPKGNDGYPFLIYKEYTSLDEFDPAHFPEIGLMFMVRDGSSENVPVYRYTGDSTNPYSHTTDMATAEGLKGDKGDKGDQGEQGIQGEKGVDGITYTPVIGTITTASSDSDAAADVVVDNNAKTATFNFSIPRGPQGIQGPQGEQGIQGEKGIDGSTYTPAIGTVTTVNAASEASADIVVDSENKIAQFNFSIPRGSQGLQGIQGPKGEPGETGADGADGTTYIPSIGTVSTVDSFAEASAEVSLNEETKEAVFNFNIPKGVSIEKVEFTYSSLGDVAGLPGATDTYTITYTDTTTSTYEVYNGNDCNIQIDDKTASETSVYSSAKIDEKYGVYTFGTAGATQWLKLTLGNSSKFQPIVISDQYGGKVEITGMADDGTYRPVKLVRYSYGDWTTYSATDYTTTDAGDANYKIRRLFYYPAGSCYYLEIRQYCTIKVSGATTKPEMVTSLPVETSAMTLIPESNWARIDDANLASTTSTWSSSKIASETAKKKQVMQLPYTISNNKFSVTYSDVAALIDKYCNFADSGVKQNAYVPFYLTCYTSYIHLVLSCYAKFEGAIYLDKVVYSSDNTSAEITQESDVNFISLAGGGTPTSLFVTI